MFNPLSQDFADNWKRKIPKQSAYELSVLIIEVYTESLALTVREDLPDSFKKIFEQMLFFRLLQIEGYHKEFTAETIERFKVIYSRQEQLGSTGYPLKLEKQIFSYRNNFHS